MGGPVYLPSVYEVAEVKVSLTHHSRVGHSKQQGNFTCKQQMCLLIADQEGSVQEQDQAQGVLC